MPRAGTTTPVDAHGRVIAPRSIESRSSGSSWAGPYGDLLREVRRLCSQASDLAQYADFFDHEALPHVLLTSGNSLLRGRERLRAKRQPRIRRAPRRGARLPALRASSNERRAAGCDLPRHVLAVPRSGSGLRYVDRAYRVRRLACSTRASTHARGLTNIVGRSMCLVFQSFASPHTKRGPRSSSSEERTARLLKRLVPRPCAVHFNVGDFASARSVPVELPRSFGLL